MEQLTTLDAGFLEAEDADRHISLAIGGLVIMAGPPPDYRSLAATLQSRIGGCPRMVQKLRLHPFDLAPPQWVPDDGFSLAHHLSRVALPEPGGDAELHRFVADAMARRLDRDHPLWHIWVVEGLGDGRWAMLMKIHHCVGDGIATARLFTMLCDDQCVDSFASHLPAAHDDPATGRRPRWPGLPDVVNPMRLLSGVWNASLALGATAAQAARGAVELSAGILSATASTSLNGPMSAMRRYSAARVPLDDVNRICRAYGVTVNDVALAALTEGYRGMLIRRGEPTLPESMRTLVPVSIRATDELGAVTANRVSVMLPYLPVDEDDPVQRLRTVHARLTRTKSTGQRQAGSVFVSASNYLPFTLTAWAVRLLARLPQHGVTTLATNVPGPAQTLHMMGRPVLGVLPVPPIALQLRTGVAILSYTDSLFFGILADFDTMPDIDEFARSLEAAVARLAGAGRGGAGRGGLSLVAGG